MEYLEFAMSWLAANPRLVTAWTVVLMLALAWLWRGHRASRERARFKPLRRPAALHAGHKGAGPAGIAKSKTARRPTLRR